jgi:hypothetical protein
MTIHDKLTTLAAICAVVTILTLWFGYKVARGGRHFRDSVRRQADLDG